MDPKKLAALSSEVKKDPPKGFKKSLPPERTLASTKDKKIAGKIGKMVQDGNVDDELMDLMYDFDPEHNPPSWVANESIWERAKDAVDPEGEGDKYDDPYAVVAHVYRNLGGKIK